MQRRAILLATLASPLAPPLATPALAQGWPQRPIRIVVPFGTGGSADVAARALQEPLTAALGQPVVWKTALAPALSSAPMWWQNPPPTARRCC